MFISTEITVALDFSTDLKREICNKRFYSTNFVAFWVYLVRFIVARKIGLYTNMHVECSQYDKLLKLIRIKQTRHMYVCKQKQLQLINTEK